MGAGGRQVEPDLAALKGHGHGRAHHGARDRAAVDVDTAGQIDGHDRHELTIEAPEPAKRGLDRPARRPAASGPEQRVDDDRPAAPDVGKRVGKRVEDCDPVRAREPELTGDRVVVARAHQHRAHSPAAPVQLPRDREAVAAVVPRPDQDEDLSRVAGVRDPLDLRAHGQRRALHQHGRRHAEHVHRVAVGRRRELRGPQLR
ncbi:hypothetical protein ENSA5_64050 [Enhygromyxa salina]|uniref:Uncharacterized protein n=1 Tax=Enhygromyxa salina TaxID=215803 RepID=A0A2S9XCL6_9BACT|nr:hypothetical protein ENSA5_64050 [Enhygromyxa salina]